MLGFLPDALGNRSSKAVASDVFTGVGAVVAGAQIVMHAAGWCIVLGSSACAAPLRTDRAYCYFRAVSRISKLGSQTFPRSVRLKSLRLRPENVTACPSTISDAAA